jgi:hypothetical protein
VWLDVLGDRPTHHRINQFDTVIIRRIVAGSNHDTNPLSTEFLRAKTSEQTHSEYDCVEDVTS